MDARSGVANCHRDGRAVVFVLDECSITVEPALHRRVAIKKEQSA